MSDIALWIRNLGYVFTGEVIADGKIRRLHIDGEKRSSCTYSFTRESDHAYGWLMCHRDGVLHKYSHFNKDLLIGERKRIEAAHKARRVANEAKEREIHHKAALRAQSIWNKAGAASELHPYVARKGVDALGVRQIGNKILVPVMRAGELINIQRIYSDGSKRFLSGGAIKGGYFCIIRRDDNQDKIVICEGWATGASIRMATGFPVVVVFNCGNIKEVVRNLRSKYQNAELIIAADNDQWTTIRGEHKNVGLDKAREAAALYDCLVAYPAFPADDKQRRTDFNDYYLEQGAIAVRNLIESAQPVEKDAEEISDVDAQHLATQIIPLDAYQEDIERLYSADSYALSRLYKDNTGGGKSPDKNWREHLRLTDKGVLKPQSLTNVCMFLENDERYAQLFCYDLFSHEKMLVNCPPWEDPARFVVRPVCDEDITRLAVDIEIKRTLTPPLTMLKLALNSVIMKTGRNPAQEYFNSLQWDGKERLDTWLQYYLGAEEDDHEYLRLVSSRWLTAVIYRVFEPGYKFDHMLVLEGDQGCGKSLALRELSTIYGNAYFDDTLKVTDLGSDKAVPKLQGILICELAEMSGLNRKDINELKQAITITNDRIVKKYANEATLYPRQFVFAGTINPVKGYLSDSTGERRFWPVRVGNIDIEALKKDKDQLWAEAVMRYRRKERIWIDQQEQALFDDAQAKRAQIDPWEYDIAQAVGFSEVIAPSDMESIWRAIGVERGRRDSFLEHRVNKVLMRLGYTYSRKQYGGIRKYMWIKKNERQ